MFVLFQRAISSKIVPVETELMIKAFGQQVSLFNNGTPAPTHSEGESKEGKGGHLTLKNHRWHLDDDYREEAKNKGKEDTSDHHSKDPNQADMFPDQAQAPAPKPPLAQVMNAVEKNEAYQKEQKEKEWKDLAGEYIRNATAQKPMFLSDMDDVATENGLERCSDKFGAYAVKDEDSIINKFKRNEAKGNPQANKNLTDTLRTTLVINSPSQWEAIKDSFEKRGYQIWNNDVSNLYKDKKAGYKHIAVKLTKGDPDKDPVVKELLLMRPNMLEAKNGFGHEIYDIDKNIISAIPEAERNPAIQERLRKSRDVFMYYSNKHYAKAYKKDLEEEKSGRKSQDSVDSTLEDISSPDTFINPKSRAPRSKSSRPPKVVAMLLKEDFGKTIWAPIRAKLSASSSDTPDISGVDTNSRIASLISDSILNPLLKVYDLHTTGQYNLYSSLQLGQNITNGINRLNRFSKSRLYSLVK